MTNPFEGKEYDTMLAVLAQAKLLVEHLDGRIWMSPNEVRLNYVAATVRNLNEAWNGFATAVAEHNGQATADAIVTGLAPKPEILATAPTAPTAANGKLEEAHGLYL